MRGHVKRVKNQFKAKFSIFFIERFERIKKGVVKNFLNIVKTAK